MSKKKTYNWELWYGEVMTSVLSLQNYFLPTPNIHLHLGMGPGSSYSNLVSPPWRSNLFRNKQSQESILVREWWRRVPKIKPEEESKGMQGETNYSKKHSSTWFQSHSIPLNSLFPFLGSNWTSFLTLIRIPNQNTPLSKQEVKRHHLLSVK